MPYLFILGFLIASINTVQASDLASLFDVDKNELVKQFQPPVGTLLTRHNIADFSQSLDSDVAQLIKDGDVEIEVGEPNPFAINRHYVSATEQHYKTVELGDQAGIIKNYVSGRPFPMPLALDDDRAGDKAAWNMRYIYAPDENEVSEFIWHYKNMRTGKLERNLEMYGSMLRYKHRHTHEPMPNLADNRADIFNALYLRVDRPQDLRNTQLLIHRQEDDTRSEKAWMYSATQRRVRVLGTGQTTDAFLGSDIMIEDFLGFNGRIMDMTWNYRGSRWVLLPLYRRSELAVESFAKKSKSNQSEFQLIDFHGKGSCFPKVSWQLRKTYIVEAIPKSASHPLSKRVFYIDAQSYSPVLTKIYDRAGKLWKLGLAAISDSEYHHPNNKAWQGGITDAVSMIDLQAEHCTTIQMLPVLPARPLQPNQFTPQQLRAVGR